MVFFTSDQHYSHSNIIIYCNRPFASEESILNRSIDISSVHHMNEELVRKFNEKVGPGDTAYHLGDFSLSKDVMKKILPRLNGEHHLIMGNHDHIHPCQARTKTKAENMAKFYAEAGFKTVKLTDTMFIDGQTVVMHHMPYARSEDDTTKGERFVDYRLKDEGLILLHGHVHNAWIKKGKQINVGVDRNNFEPYSIDDIINLMKIEGDIL